MPHNKFYNIHRYLRELNLNLKVVRKSEKPLNKHKFLTKNFAIFLELINIL